MLFYCIQFLPITFLKRYNSIFVTLKEYLSPLTNYAKIYSKAKRLIEVNFTYYFSFPATIST
jgi:hypothetical protein